MSNPPTPPTPPPRPVPPAPGSAASPASKPGPGDDTPPFRYTAALADEIELRWQAAWDERGTFIAPNPGQPGFDRSKPKFYCLDMFPYPSGAGLHVGHPEGYTASDIVSRFMRMKGYNVLHPMGWDAFGLPAEQYAIQTGIHPAITTRRAIETFRRQLKRFGFSYDWSREVGTIDPDYYKWTQWIFLRAYNAWFDPQAPNATGTRGRARPISELLAELEAGDLRVGPGGQLVHIGVAASNPILGGEPVGTARWHELAPEQRRAVIDDQRLVYLGQTTVNWCPALGTVLANDEVIDGRSERGGHPVFRKPLKQWMFRITAYAQRLLDDLVLIDWPDSTKTMQSEWIGRSEGAEIDFPIVLGTPPLRGGFRAANRDLEPTHRELVRLAAELLGARGRSALEPIDFFARDPYPPGDYGPVRELVATRRFLPHLNLPDATYFVTWKTHQDRPLSDAARDRAMESLLHFDGERCRVYAAVVMSNHVHWIVRPYEGVTLDKLVASVKRFSATEINKFENSSGHTWEAERFDHIVRDRSAFNKFVEYVIDNPVSAGVVGRAEEYRWTFVHPEAIGALGEQAVADMPASERRATQILRVFTTRPDTVFGATYMVVAPEHWLVEHTIKHPTPETDLAALKAYVHDARNKAEVDRMADTKEKTGVFTGMYCINPASGQRIPVWTADYVLMGYGHGAIMAVPAHDERDFAFAAKFGLPIVDVVYPRTMAAMAYFAEHAPPEFRQENTWARAAADFLGLVTTASGEPELFPMAMEALRERRAAPPGADTSGINLDELPPGTPRGVIVGGWVAAIKEQFDSFQDLVDSFARRDVFARKWHAAFAGNGYAANSANSEISLNGMPTAAAKAAITEWFATTGQGNRKINFRLRDWAFSRQRYWGEPFPIVYDDHGNHYPVSDKSLPVELPEMADYSPVESDDPQPLLAKASKWIHTTADQAGVDPDVLPAQTLVRREANTMPGSAGSSWYFLRYCDPKNGERFISREADQYWMGGVPPAPEMTAADAFANVPLRGGPSGAADSPDPADGAASSAPTGTRNAGVDLYIGGSEHAVGHLLYSRFWQKILFDLGEVCTPEPFGKLFHQGMITSYAYQRPDKSIVPTDEVKETTDGAFVEIATGSAVTPVVTKMSKRYRNVVNPDDIIAQFGADTFRVYEMYMGPLDASKPWNTKDAVGIFRFLQRVWRLAVDEQTGALKLVDQPRPEIEKQLHRVVAKVEHDIPKLAFNTAIAALIEFTNAATTAGGVSRSQLEMFTLALAPFAPHIAEELWLKLGHGTSLAYEPFPRADAKLLVDDVVEIPVQIGGKVKGRISIPAASASDKAAVEQAALADDTVKAALAGKKVTKVIVVPGKMVNIVAN